MPQLRRAGNALSAQDRIDIRRDIGLGSGPDGTVQLNAGTLTTNTPSFDATQTWNNAGVTFTGVRLNVIDTASASGSMLLDLQVGGTTRFRVERGGNVFAANLLRSENAIQAQNLITGATIGGLSEVYIGGAQDVRLFRDAANTLAQRNGTNPQEFRVYNTFTDSNNHERGGMRWVSNEFWIGTDAAGTGVQRNPVIGRGSTYLISFSGTGVQSSTRVWNQSNTSTIDLYPNRAGLGFASIESGQQTIRLGPQDGATAHDFRADGSYQMTEVATDPAAPAANQARLFCRDNGSGASQVCVRFATGAAIPLVTEGVGVAGGGGPAGTSGQIQFNNAGAFGGVPGWTWDNANSRMEVPALALSRTVAAGQFNAAMTFRLANDNGANTRTFGFLSQGGNPVQVQNNGTTSFNFSGSGIAVPRGTISDLIGIGFSGATGTEADTTLSSLAPGFVDLRRNPWQTQIEHAYRAWGTFTDASNYRRVAFGMTPAGVAYLRPEGAGTGASGNVLHISGLPTSNPGPGILWNDAGTVRVGT